MPQTISTDEDGPWIEHQIDCHLEMVRIIFLNHPKIWDKCLCKSLNKVRDEMLDKGISSGKEWRKEYRKSQAFDRSCRNHGSCPHCSRNRT